jgi:PAS domain S-box-containing protein
MKDPDFDDNPAMHNDRRLNPADPAGGLLGNRKSRQWFIAIILLIIAAGTILTIGTAVHEDRVMREELLTHARIADAGINFSEVAALSGTPADLSSPAYRSIKRELEAVRSADPSLRFAYLIGRRPDGMYFFFVDSEPPESADYSPPGQEYPEATPLVINVYTRGEALTDGPASDRWGTWVSAGVPVNDPVTGQRIAMFGIDEDARDWFRQIVMACLVPVAGTLLVLALMLFFFFLQQRNDRERMYLEASRQVLRESEERYRHLFTQSPLGIIHLNTEGIITTANRKFAEIIGVRQAELIGFDTLKRIRNPLFREAVRQALEGKTGFFEGEYTSVLATKRSILRLVCQPLGAQGSIFSGVICIAEDITERWEAEQKEKQQNAFFIHTQQALMQLSRIPLQDMHAYFSRLLVVDAQTLGVSRVSLWWFNDDRSALVCSEHYDESAAADHSPLSLKRSEYPRYFQALDENRTIAAHDARTDERTAEFTESYLVPLGISSMLDVPVRRGDSTVGILCHEHTGGMRVWSPLEQDFAAAVTDQVSSVIERTERMAAETALRESEQRYRNVVEDQEELITRYRPDGTQIFVNGAYCRFFGREKSQVIGEKFSPDVPDEDRVMIQEHFAQLSKENPVGEITHRIIRPDGRISWMRWIDRAIFDETGRISEFQSVGRDITWQKETEETLCLLNQKLNLLSSITRHDVLNQLIILRGFLKLGSELADDPEKVRVFIDKAIKAAVTIEHQIMFTRDYQEMGVKAPSWQDIRKNIVHAKGALATVDIRTDLEHPDTEILADPLLEKVFFNLIDNAIRYGGGGMTRVRISTREVPEGLLLIFEDNGSGIPDEDKKRLFTRGFGKNTGFGLFLSREILAVSGITITETGTYGTGARFEILVPPGSYRYTS